VPCALCCSSARRLYLLRCAVADAKQGGGRGHGLCVVGRLSRLGRGPRHRRGSGRPRFIRCAVCAALTARQLANRIVMETPRVLERSTTRLLAMKYLRTRLCVASPFAVSPSSHRHPRCSGGGKRYVTLLMALLRSAHTSPTLLAAVCDEVRSFCVPLAGVLTAGRSRRWRQNRRPMRRCVRSAWLASCASSCSVTVRLRSITLCIWY
jgi:hypothetical protein